MTVARTTNLESYLRQRLANKPLLLMTHMVVGYPSLDDNWTMLEAMEKAGVDLVELQLPFSDPIADGPYFVKANQDAIQAGSAWRSYFDLAARAATHFSLPFLFMGYYNSVFRMGAQRFCERLSETGMKGFILPDLPPEEAGELNKIASGHKLDPILIVTPTTTQARLAEIARQASGFIYCAARKGVTGRKTDFSKDVVAFLQRCRAATSLPLGVGFGVSTAADVRELRSVADIAIVGTAGLEAWQKHGADGYQQFLKSLVAETI